MGMEGGGRFDSYPADSGSPEGPYGCGIEEEPRHKIEGAAFEAGNRTWIADIIDPAKLERVRQLPAYAERSDEWIILEALMGKLVQGGGEMDPHLRDRLRNLVGILRALFYPNMHPEEQEIISNVINKTSMADFSKSQWNVNDEVISDVTGIWRSFGLKLPSGRPGMSGLEVDAIGMSGQFRLVQPAR